MSQDAALWNDSTKAAEILKERGSIQGTIERFQNLLQLHGDAETALELARDSGDDDITRESMEAISSLERQVEREEFFCKMSGPFDRSHAIVEINGGSGGTEAQDWAAMLLRMYVRWAERKGFQLEELEYQPGEVAGIKRATILVQGEYAYGFLRSEQGVHRLVRISPFDSNARRHTSFASIAVTPDIEEDIEITVDEKDLRIDTYRSGGAGGQHVNKTDSAVRLTHIPTGIVVACQNERSQHKNKDRAMKILKAKLYEMQKREQDDKIKQVQGERKQIDFGSQIRNYVLHPYKMVKDLRTGYETSATDAVLDGDLDAFIESYLLGGSNQTSTT